MAKTKKFSISKHLKSLSRASGKAPGAKIVPNKKRDILKRIEKTEARKLDRS